MEKKGLDRDLNPGPRAPKARIIPLDHQATLEVLSGVPVGGGTLEGRWRHRYPWISEDNLQFGGYHGNLITNPPTRRFVNEKKLSIISFIELQDTSVS